MLQTTKSSTKNNEKHEKNYKDTTPVSIGSRQINQNWPIRGKSIYVQYENEGFTKILLAFVYALNLELFIKMKTRKCMISYWMFLMGKRLVGTINKFKYSVAFLLSIREVQSSITGREPGNFNGLTEIFMNMSTCFPKKYLNLGHDPLLSHLF